MTSPAWTPLFAVAGGVVSDAGDVMSHVAIAARDFGIPCVVGTAHATTTIADGTTITIDGDAGTVRKDPGPAEITARLARHLGIDHRFVGRLEGGETGAFEIVGPDGPRVLKASAHPGAWDGRRLGFVLNERLRLDAGWPVPRQELVHLDDGAPNQVILQELLPGRPVVELTHAIVDRLLELHERRLGLRRTSDERTWPDELRRTLTEGGSGYCLHEPLRTHSPATRRLVERIEEIGRSIPTSGWPGDDIVHWDLHAGNVLQVDGVVTAIIDTEYAVIGDAGFDLVTLALSSLDHEAEAGVRARLWASADTVAEPQHTAYVAHLLLRIIDWSIRNHGATDLDRWLAEAARVLPER